MIRCPAYSPDANVRWDEWERQIDNFLASEALARLFAMYGFKIKGDDVRSRLSNAATFARMHWDYRSMQQTTERWEVADCDSIVAAHRDEMAACAEELGMLTENMPSVAWGDDAETEWILVLGGARTANHDRARTARQIRNRCRVASMVVGLAALRPLGQAEVEYVTGLVPHAEAGKTTEYDIMRAAIQKVFQYHDDGTPHTDMTGRAPTNSDWAVHRHDDRIFTIAAPSSNPARRTNTLDTLVFFDCVFSPATRSRIVGITSPLYVGYRNCGVSAPRLA